MSSIPTSLPDRPRDWEDPWVIARRCAHDLRRDGVRVVDDIDRMPTAALHAAASLLAAFGVRPSAGGEE